MKKQHRLLALVFTLIAADAALAHAADHAATPDRAAWFSEAKFGMFIHWGPFAVQGDDPNASFDYFAMKDNPALEKQFTGYAQQFSPTAFDASAWVRTAQLAGMRYIVFTSKHHDGYAMFESALTNYDAMEGSPKRDFVRELIKAARAANLHIGFYYSMLDWHEPSYSADLPRFVDQFMFGQVRELCSNYGPIDCLWFDGEWDHPADAWRAPELVQMIRKLQPNALINDRLGKGERGVTPLCDFYTREQPSEVNVAMDFEHTRVRPWEACMTIGDYWQFSRKDTHYKSSHDLMVMLVDIVSRGGNLLLNVGPAPNGVIPQPLVERLEDLGAWLMIYGESIYGVSRSPFKEFKAGWCTVKGNRLYIHLDGNVPQPAGPIVLPGLKNAITRARMMGTDEALTFDNEAKSVSRPPRIPADQLSVMVVELDGPAKVD